MSRPERRRAVPGAMLSALADQLSDRDSHVLSLLAEHRFLTTRHLEQLAFLDHATPDAAARACRRVLARLCRCGLIERPVRRVGGLQAGSASSIWMLCSAGQRLLNQRAGLGAIGRVREPGERFIQHYLAIADAHVALRSAERSKLLELLGLQIEPRCWRTFTGLGGGAQTLKPDLSAVIGNGEYEDHWFIEIDRGTESLPVLIRQCQQYETYRRTGVEQADGGTFPRVLWLVPDSHRAERLAERIQSARTLDQQLFQVTTTDQLIPIVTGAGQ